MGDDTEDIRAQQEKQARERITRSVNEFVDEHPETRRVGKVAEDGKYGHPFHDKVAAYINDANTNAKLQGAFMEGFYSQQRDKALDYLRSSGIINASTPTSRINEFLAAWNIPPLPDQESADVTIDVGTLRAKLQEGGLSGEALDDAVRIAEHESGSPVNVGEATVTTEPMVTKTGKVLTDADIEALADEAERGYDISRLKPRITPSQDDEIVDAEVIEDE